MLSLFFIAMGVIGLLAVVLVGAFVLVIMIDVLFTFYDFLQSLRKL